MKASGFNNKIFDDSQLIARLRKYRNYFSRPSIKEILLEARRDKLTKYHSFLYIFRQIILLGITVRFLLNINEVSSISLSIIAISLLCFLAYIILLNQFKHKEQFKVNPKLKNFLQIQIFFDTVFISIFYILTDKSSSDMYVFYLLPLFIAAEQFEKEDFLKSLFLTCFALGITILYIDHSLSAIPRKVLPRAFFLSLISGLMFLYAQYSLKVLLHIFKNMLNGIGSGITVIDKNNFDIIFMNKFQANLLDYDNHVDSKCYEIIHHKDTKCDNCPLDFLVNDNFISQNIPREKKNKKKLFHVISGNLNDLDGTANLALKIDTDITERENLILIADALTQQEPANLDNILRTISKGIIDLGYSDAKIYKVSEDRDKLECLFQYSVDTADHFTNHSYKLKWNQFSKFAEPIFFTKGNHLDFSTDFNLTADNILFPLSIRSRIVGMLCVEVELLIDHFETIRHLKMYANHISKAIDAHNKLRNERELRRIDDHIASTLNPKDILTSLVEYAYRTNPSIIGCRLDLCENNILKKVHGKGLWEHTTSERAAVDCKIYSLPMDKLQHECSSFCIEDDPCGIRLTEAGIDTSNIGKIICYRLQIADGTINQSQGVLSIQLMEDGEVNERIGDIISRAQMTLKTASRYDSMSKDHNFISQKDEYKVNALKMLSKIETAFRNNNYRPEKFKFLTLTGLTMNEGMKFTRAIIFNKDLSGKWRFEMGIGALNQDEAAVLWSKLEDGIDFDAVEKKEYQSDTLLHNTLKDRTFDDGDCFFNLEEPVSLSLNTTVSEFLPIVSKLSLSGYYTIIPFKLFEKKGFVYVDNEFKPSVDFLFHKDITDIATFYVHSMIQWIEKKINEEKLIEGKDNAIWEQVAREVPHKMRTHSSGMIGNLQNLNDLLGDLKVTPEINKTIMNLLSSAKTVNSFLEEFQNYSKMDRLTYERIRLYDFVEDCLKTCGIQKRNIDVSFSIDKSIEVYLDKVKMGVSFVEIFSNAADFVPKDRGELRIEACYATDQEISIFKNLNSGKKHIRINIIDNGKGIPEINRQEIFEPLVSYRPDADKIHSGLGLAIAKKYINKHDGHIYVKGQYGERSNGANFEIFLPVYNNKTEGT